MVVANVLLSISASMILIPGVAVLGKGGGGARWSAQKFCLLRVLVLSIPTSLASRALYGDTLGITFKEDAGGYLYTGALQGAKHFALWPLSQAAQSCFGSDSWPDDIPVPQAWLEFEVENVENATADLEFRGYRMLVKNKTEPWGQTVSRFISPERLLVAVTFTPLMREQR